MCGWGGDEAGLINFSLSVALWAGAFFCFHGSRTEWLRGSLQVAHHHEVVVARQPCAVMLRRDGNAGIGPGHVAEDLIAELEGLAHGLVQQLGGCGQGYGDLARLAQLVALTACGVCVGGGKGFVSESRGCR